MRPLATCQRTARCFERETTLDVAKQVSQLNVRRELCRLMLWRHFVFSALMRVHSEKEHTHVYQQERTLP
jgi:hypothetical protein